MLSGKKTGDLQQFSASQSKQNGRRKLSRRTCIAGWLSILTIEPVVSLQKKAQTLTEFGVFSVPNLARPLLS